MTDTENKRLPEFTGWGAAGSAGVWASPPSRASYRDAVLQFARCYHGGQSGSRTRLCHFSWVHMNVAIIKSEVPSPPPPSGPLSPQRCPWNSPSTQSWLVWWVAESRGPSPRAGVSGRWTPWAGWRGQGGAGTGRPPAARGLGKPTPLLCCRRGHRPFQFPQSPAGGAVTSYLHSS